MKLYLSTLILWVSIFTSVANATPVNDLKGAFDVANSTLGEKINGSSLEADFQISYEYRGIYEDDQPIIFHFQGTYQSCEVEVGSQSLKVTSIGCRNQLTSKEETVCDKDGFFIFETGANLTHLFGNSRFELVKVEDLTFASYGGETFERVIFSDDSLRTGVLEKGLMSRYGDVIQTSIKRTPVSRDLCQ